MLYREFWFPDVLGVAEGTVAKIIDSNYGILKSGETDSFLLLGQRLSAHLVTKRWWVQILLDAGLFLFSNLSVGRPYFRALEEVQRF